MSMKVKAGFGKWAAAILLLLWIGTPSVQAAERVALVIGNGAYQHAARLNNPRQDAVAVAAALRRMNFSVTRVDEADKTRLTRELAAFRARSRNAEIALLYYAGHAIQVEGRNYLVPVDAKIEELGDLGLYLLRLNDALQQLQGQVNVVILDACRDNPFADSLNRSAVQLGRQLGATRGLVREETLLGGGTYLMMAAAPEAIALDGPPGGNSPYTAALLQYLETPNLDLRFLHAKVREAVEEKTSGVQTPEAIDRLPSRPIYLAGISVEPSSVPPSSLDTSPPLPTLVSPQTLELEFWRSIQGSSSPADFEAYLEQYPQGSFAALARARIAALQVQPLAASPESRPAPPAPPAPVRLSVKATPADARIRIMNIVPVYQDGMELAPGRYDLEISARGYQTHRRWVELAAGDRVLEVALERIPERPRVEPTPAPVASTPTSNPNVTRLIEGRYQVRGRNSEIIHDTVTGLEWMRCSLGQTWNSTTQRCTGDASEHTFDGAQSAAAQLNRSGGYGGYTDWRLPSIEELRTIVHCSSGQPAYFKNNNSWCEGSYSHPTIVQAAFPDTPGNWFWSGSPRDYYSNYAWVVGFDSGDAFNPIQSFNLRVRLVRGGQ